MKVFTNTVATLGLVLGLASFASQANSQEIPTSLAEGSVTANSVTLTWTAPGDDGTSGTASYYDIRYSQQPLDASTWDGAVQVQGESAPQPAGSAESFTVTGLTPSTSYYFAIKAGDEVPNWSDMSNVIVRTTASANVAPADIATLAASVTTDSSVTLVWTSPTDDGPSGRASLYDLRVSTQPITESNWASAIQIVNEPTPGPAGTQDSIVIYSLSASTTYYFAIKSADDEPLWSALSNIESSTTKPEVVPPALILNLTAINPTPTSLDLRWTAPGDDDSTGTATSYDIRYATEPITESNWASATQVQNVSAPQSAGTQEGITVTNLNSGVLYYFAIKTSDEVPNTSGLSNIASETTAPENIPPATIIDLSSLNIWPTSFDLTWTAPGDDGMTGTASQYDIRCSESLDALLSWDNADQVAHNLVPSPAGSVQTITLSDLNPGTTYYVAVKTSDEMSNMSLISNVVSATCPVPPSPVADFVCTPLTGTAPLIVEFTDLSLNEPTEWIWDFGDGQFSTEQNPTHTYEMAGSYRPTLQVINLGGSDILVGFDEIVVSPDIGDGVAVAAPNLSAGGIGTVSGLYSDTHVEDGVSQTITEVLSGTSRWSSYSNLDYRWQFDVIPGNQIVFELRASRTDNAEGDDFAFEYSTDNAHFYRAVTVASSNMQTYTAEIPNSLSGVVHVRVVDTDRSRRTTSLDGVSVDYMSFTSSGTAPQSNTMIVASMDVSRLTAAWKRYRGQAVVTVEDIDGNPVEGAFVTGRFEGPSSETVSALSGSDGQAVLLSSIIRKASDEWCFSVTDVSHFGDTFDSMGGVDLAMCESDALQQIHTPDNFDLAQNSPNPFNPTTEISFSLPEASDARLEVFNTLGQKVATLADGYFGAGVHYVHWDASSFASGMYFYRVEAGDFSETRKMVLIK